MPKGKNAELNVPDHVALDKEWGKALGHAIRRARENKQWTLIDLAGQLDASFQYVGLMERGEKTPSMQMFLMMLRALEVDANTIVGALLNYEENETIPLPQGSRYSELSATQKTRLFRIINDAIEGFLDSNE